MTSQARVLAVVSVRTDRDVWTIAAGLALRVHKEQRQRTLIVDLDPDMVPTQWLLTVAESPRGGVEAMLEAWLAGARPSPQSWVVAPQSWRELLLLSGSPRLHPRQAEPAAVDAAYARGGAARRCARRRGRGARGHPRAQPAWTLGRPGDRRRRRCARRRALRPMGRAGPGRPRRAARRRAAPRRRLAAVGARPLAGDLSNVLALLHNERAAANALGAAFVADMVRQTRPGTHVLQRMPAEPGPADLARLSEQLRAVYDPLVGMVAPSAAGR